MKKILFCLVMFVLASSVMAEDTSATALSWRAWDKVKTEAFALDNAGKYTEAIAKFGEYITLANYLNRPDIVAWGYNNIAYCIIKMHKADKSTDLKPALANLNTALGIKFIDAKCLPIVQSNLEYVNNYLKLVPVKKPVTKEAVKK